MRDDSGGTDTWAAQQARERRPAAVREADHMTALPALIAHARRHSVAGAERLQGIDPQEITSRAALAQLPLLRKTDLLARQQASRAAGGDPFGGFATIGWGVRGRGVQRVFQSPGPLYEPEGAGTDWWQTARALSAAGIRGGDLVHIGLSYHLSPGAWIMERGALALGCSVLPGGVGQIELQLAAIQDLQPTAYVGAPSLLRLLLERSEAARAGADEVAASTADASARGTAGEAARDTAVESARGADAGAHQRHRGLSFQRALVTGEACPPPLTAWFRERGVDVYQCYATADLGLIAYETEAHEGLVLDEDVLVEIVRPGTGDPVPEGEVGEVVVTRFNPDYPLIRFATGDLSAVLPGPCPSGRTQTRLRGWLGRADQTTKVRGMFIRPEQVAQVLQQVPRVRRARLVVSGAMANDQLLLQAELPAGPDDGADRAALAAQLVTALRDITRLRGEVGWVAVGALPNDGRIIVDERATA